MTPLKFTLLLLVSTIIFACQTTQKITRKDKKMVRQLIENDPILSTHFTGFVLYDPSTKEILVQKNAHQYFTPASNTKILTLFTALEILEQRVGLFQYAALEDTIILQGMANPTFLHSKFDQIPLPHFLTDTSRKVFFSADNFKDGRYGEGWMWDDYNYAFQSEKSPFPTYANTIQIELAAGANTLNISPSYFAEVFYNTDETSDRLRIKRDEKFNFFEYQLPEKQEKNYVTQKPFITTDAITSALLSDTIHRKIRTWTDPTDHLRFKPINIPMEDTVYRRLMHQSDNFIAEQLLLMCAQKKFGYQNTKTIITYAKDSIFNFLTDELLWADGSGISRYNLFTPHALVQILDVLQQKIPLKRIKDLFPAGGASGTIQHWYGGEAKPYLFAKTGSLRNNHNLSGYLITKSNRLLIFSFMNNHFKGSSSKAKEKMAKVFQFIYNEY